MNPVLNHIGGTAWRAYAAGDGGVVAAARAFIGDEINAKYEAAKPILNRWDPRDDGYEYGLDIAESIARGDTK